MSINRNSRRWSELAAALVGLAVAFRLGLTAEQGAALVTAAPVVVAVFSSPRRPRRRARRRIPAE